VNLFFNVVLIEPEIPQNTGNIGRTCVGTNSKLHLVKPYGFEITDKNLKRAGLDYWPHLQWQEYESTNAWQSTLKADSRVFYFSTHAQKSYFDVQFKKGDIFVFGKETQGLPKDLLRREASRAVKIPQFGPIRGLNLATAVAIVLYEAIRQCEIKVQAD
jgi:tRNA (cytidine/uridine-2'-O-)-methyltransferase